MRSPFLPSKEEIEEYMRSVFPECPICTSKEGYKVGEYHLVVMAECKNCGARWGSPQFSDLKPMQEIILWQAPKDGRYRLLEGFSKRPSFWASHGAHEFEKYAPPLSNWDPEKCPRCGRPMIRGWIIATTMSFMDQEKYPGNWDRLSRDRIYSVGDSLGQQLWRGGGIRTYYCDICGLYLSYEQDPKTGESTQSWRPWDFPEYSPPAKDEKKVV
jgi:uncharacterized protein (DUF983 family)